MISHSKSHLDSNDKISIGMAVSSGMLTTGNANKQFAAKLQKTLDVGYINLTTSGTMAFYKIMLALGIGKGDEVLLPNYICHSLLAPIYLLGAKVVLYDNEKYSWLSSVDKVLEKVSPLVKIVLINHSFGFAFKDLDKLRKELPESTHLVEDSCHSVTPKQTIGTTKVGISSICTFYSFNATKYLATGEGGAISTNDSNFFKELNKMAIGDNLSDFSCSLGISQLEKLDYFVERRNEIAFRYLDHFRDFVPSTVDIHSSSFYRFPIWLKKTDNFFDNSEVSFRRGVDALLSEPLGVKALRNSQEALESTVSIPIYPALKNEEVNKIIQTTKKLLS